MGLSFAFSASSGANVDSFFSDFDPESETVGGIRGNFQGLRFPAKSQISLTCGKPTGQRPEGVSAPLGAEAAHHRSVHHRTSAMREGEAKQRKASCLMVARAPPFPSEPSWG